MSTLGDRIREIRAGLSQAKFAELLGVHKNSLQYWEKGERFPDYAVLIEFIKKFDLSAEWLLLGTGPKHVARASSLDMHANVLSTENGQSVPIQAYEELYSQQKQVMKELNAVKKQRDNLKEELRLRTGEALDAYKLLLKTQGLEGRAYFDAMELAVKQMLVKYPFVDFHVDDNILKYMYIDESVADNAEHEDPLKEDAISGEDLDDNGQLASDGTVKG